MWHSFYILTIIYWVILLSIWCSSAIDIETGKQVALKKLARPFQSPVHAKRAYREIKLMKLLTKSNTNVRPLPH